MTRRLVQAIRHVGFEDLGSFAPVLEDAGYVIAYVDAATDDLSTIDPLAADLLVVLGGPVGVYDHQAYPVLAREMDILRRRLGADRPTLGICLGAQLMAHALGARVYPGPGKEIGWSRLSLTEQGAQGPLAALQAMEVLHWHGDTFDLPDRCDLLASTEMCRHQAFSRGANSLALQFHAEPLAANFERWLFGHAGELATAGVDPIGLREEAARYAAPLEPAAGALIRRWLAGLV